MQLMHSRLHLLPGQWQRRRRPQQLQTDHCQLLHYQMLTQQQQVGVVVVVGLVLLVLGLLLWKQRISCH